MNRSEHNVLKIALSDSESFDVVCVPEAKEFLFTFARRNGAVTRRLTCKLTREQSFQLAIFLANITPMPGNEDWTDPGPSARPKK